MDIVERLKNSVALDHYDRMEAAREIKTLRELLFNCEQQVIRAERERDRFRSEADNKAAAWSSAEKHLAACQAREAKLREYVESEVVVVNDDAIIAKRKWQKVLIALPTDDTALREYGKKVLLEAAERIGSAEFMSSPEARKSYAEYNELRRMAEEG